ncbi:unnamed protein product [Clavelina lepadiformis]|uniref:Spermatogenesis-defective protein 39 homolog n=1 Tax=Clavelina lepadiformis TaxID=159417 RepID=A0ABP0FKN5_CLALP
MSSVRFRPSGAQPKEGDDDYWNSSGFKPFNFNDDDDEEDSIDVIRWDGSTAAPIRPKSQTSLSKHRPPVTQAMSSPACGITSARAYGSARKQHFPSSPATLPQHSEPMTAKPNGAARPTSGTDQRTLTEVVTAHSAPTATDFAKLETANYSLRRQLAQAKRDQAAAPSKSETLCRLITGGTYILELYKSKEDKAALLDGAIQRHDGNAILAATLFMRDTLKRDLFSKELMKRAVAVDHYCAYLRAAGEIDELHETLSALGRTEEAAMLKYRQCLATTSASNPEIRSSALKDCIKYYFDCDLRLSNETSAIQEQIMLMERQSAVEDSDSAAEKSGTVQVFKSHPRRDSIVYKSVITTLYYCCYYHWGEAEGLLSSPTSIKNQHKIGEKQFLYTALAALCRMRRWRDIEALLTVPKSLFRSARLHATIGFDKVVDVLSKNLAPPDALGKYCAEIEGNEKRLEMAIRLKSFKVAIDTLVYTKDRQKLMAYLDEIPQANQHMRQYASTQLRSQDIKWRN